MVNRWRWNGVVSKCKYSVVAISFAMMATPIWRLKVSMMIAVQVAGSVWATPPGQQSDTLEDQIVFPGSRTQGQAAAVVRPGDGCELLALHASDGTRIAAMFCKATAPVPGAGFRPTMLYFYGNGMCMADSTVEVDRLRALGFNLIVADYEGYGMSGGKASEAGCYTAADAAYDYLLTRKDVDPARIVAIGWSLGGAVAIDLANRRPVAGLITVSAFTSIADMNRAHPERLPAGETLNSRFDNLIKIRSVKCPILMVHGTDDQLVPAEMLGRLSKAASSKATVVPIAGAGHNDIFDRGGENLDKKIAVFTNRSTAHPRE